MTILRDRLMGRGTEDTSALVRWVRERGRPLKDAWDLDPLMERIGDARFVLLGEASHGTAEYYLWRTAISQRLIREKGIGVTKARNLGAKNCSGEAIVFADEDSQQDRVVWNLHWSISRSTWSPACDPATRSPDKTPSS